jgi:hypothetical protein
VVNPLSLVLKIKNFTRKKDIQPQKDALFAEQTENLTTQEAVAPEAAIEAAAAVLKNNTM